MATLLELCHAGSLVKIEGLLDDHELEWRNIYGTQSFIGWLEEGLPNLEFDSMSDSLTPKEQVAAMMAEYVNGENWLNDRRFKKLKRTPELYIWELKTVHVRIFGWVPKKDNFICCFGDSADKVKSLDLYGRYIAQCSRVRELLDLDPPKCVESGSIEDVVSLSN